MANPFLPMIPNVAVQLGTLAAQEINTVLRVKDDLKKLKRQFERMLDMIKEAEQMNKQDAKTKHWLKQLRDDIYRTDDIIDRCRIEAEKRTALKSTQCLRRHLNTIMGCGGVVVDCQISCSIRKLNVDIEKISRESFLLQERYSAMHNELFWSLCDTVPYDDPNIVGSYVEKAKTSLVTLLNDTTNQSSLVLAIVGTVGIGKTTLARQVYRCMTMSSTFNKMLWVCVGKDANYLGVLRRIMTSAGNHVESDSRDELERMLENTIRDKKFLLVLDDVWNETFWENMLENHLQCGASGSKVLVTTRHKQIAKRMGSFHVHNVKRMSDTDGWDLLRKRALLGKGEDKREMEDRGKKIADRCDGLPLVIRAIGGVLRCKEPTADCWDQVSNDIFGNLPEEVKGLIRLSYVDLPSALKKCFLYCSLFPDWFVIQKRYITQQWVSEGFIEANDPSKLEEVAEQYYRELLARSLLEPAHGQDGEIGANIPSIFRSLAEELARDENFSRDLDRISRDLDNMNNPFEPRRLSSTSASVHSIMKNLWRLRHLRTLLLFGNQELIVRHLDNSFLLRIFERLKLLRVLDLHNTNMDTVPEALGKLAHLRYLNLSNTGIKVIPSGIKNLRLLQFLILNDCKNLEYLSRSIEHLKHLRSLEISGGNILKKQTMKFNNLTELNCLRGFLVLDGKSTPHTGKSGWSLTELSSFSTLTSLQILRPERATREEARLSNLRNNESLRELELCCATANPQIQIKEIFDDLRPASSIASLKLERYYGNTYPSWLCTENLPNLQSIELNYCTCDKLPSLLGELPLLRSLVIKDMKELRAIGSELRHVGNQRNVAFPKLEKLEFKMLEKLESWSDLESDDLPCIQNLVLKECSKLRSIPDLIWRLHDLGRATLDYSSCPELPRPESTTNDSQQQIYQNIFHRWAPFLG